MQSIAECKTLFTRINLGLSEVATQGPAVGARRARKMATSHQIIARQYAAFLKKYGMV